MEQLSPLRTKLVSLYGPCETSGSAAKTYLSPCRWEPTGWKYIKHDLTPVRKRKEEKMELVTTNSTYYVDHTKEQTPNSRHHLANSRTRRKAKERFPPIPFGFTGKTADFTLSRQVKFRPNTSNTGDFTDALNYWAGRPVSPCTKAFNRKCDFTTRWEDQVLSHGTVRRF
mmetsp:Transcript_9875/g.19574  ORF Transcript_9875/g.19574 Transcript_9875/m.19574 type:complete len:170 (-) Transcript_9875:27-536(-)